MKFKALIVGGDPQVHSLICDTVGGMDIIFATTSCASGKDAIDYMQNTDYDIIIAHNDSGDIDGIEVVKQSKIKWGKTPAILITGKVIEPHNADKLLVQPFTLGELETAVKKQLD